MSCYTWLKQGREINVSAEGLDAIARVLRRDGSERAHLYRFAGLNPPRERPVSGRRVPDGLCRVMDSWLPRPAHLIDRHWNLVAVDFLRARAVSLSQPGRTSHELDVPAQRRSSW
ncbi:hypothetical protein [Streptomyces sp.]|uniref:hypothetical protein n=1 Tax=Streptomyces sp. TaxID=1931 RepID=UPI002811F397|nr:hypothetical protein [Streptomyces sp.]